MDSELLDIRGLKTHFFTPDGVVRAVDGVDLTLGRERTLGIVGESGCGKTVLALSILRLVPDPPGRIMAGKVLFEGRDLLELDMMALRGIRGNEISMIFQEPMAALNPVFSIGSQVAEVFRLHQPEVATDRKIARVLAAEMLDRVGIGNAGRRLKDYPHQLSGGMCQRVMIAMALACRPKLMIADEPTTALDVTTQAQIMDLMHELKAEIGTSIIIVTHDLGVVAQSCQEVAVMYTGRVVEYAAVEAIFAEPLHPYTKGLMLSVPRKGDSLRDKKLHAIAGSVPDLRRLPGGCTFNPRCPEVMDICRREEPPVVKAAGGRSVRCWKYV